MNPQPIGPIFFGSSVVLVIVSWIVLQIQKSNNIEDNNLYGGAGYGLTLGVIGAIVGLILLIFGQ